MRERIFEKKGIQPLYTEGEIIANESQQLSAPTYITVAYQVGDMRYRITESVKLKSEVIKWGFLPVGQMKSPKLDDVRVGAKVKVAYDPNRPSRAYIVGNEGWING